MMTPPAQGPPIASPQSPAGEVSRMCRYAKLRFFSEVTHV